MNNNRQNIESATNQCRWFDKTQLRSLEKTIPLGVANIQLNDVRNAILSILIKAAKGVQI